MSQLCLQTFFLFYFFFLFFVSCYLKKTLHSNDTTFHSYRSRQRAIDAAIETWIMKNTTLSWLIKIEYSLSLFLSLNGQKNIHLFSWLQQVHYHVKMKNSISMQISDNKECILFGLVWLLARAKPSNNGFHSFFVEIIQSVRLWNETIRTIIANKN